MSAAIQFDTLDYAKKLETAGVPVAQAEAQAKALGAVLTNTVASPGDLVAVESNLATKIDSLESRLDAKINTLESRLDAKINTLESKLDAKINTLESRLDTKINTLESRLDAKIARSESGLNIKSESVRNELKVAIQKLGGSVETLKWMLGIVATLNIGIFAKLILNH